MINQRISVESVKIDAKDGFQLSAIRRTAIGQRKGVIQIHCGTGIPQGVYASFAKFLAENGYDSITFDYRGIGRSAPKSLKGFKASLSDWGERDMAGVFAWTCSHYPHDRKIIIGHSMGGQLIGLMENNNKVDQVLFIAASTGYWHDMSFPLKLALVPMWYLLIPVSVWLFGFACMKKMRQGENLPKGVALQWRKWCINPRYFDDDFSTSKVPLYFDQLRAPVKALRISDDPIANKVTGSKILKYYTNAHVSVEEIAPEALGVHKIGHTGFFSRKFRKTLWRDVLQAIDHN